jgi:hypothetical protein
MSTPAHKIRDGVLQVTIWRNQGERGAYYTVNPTKSYQQVGPRLRIPGG